jgi:hypothetical protein
MATPGWDTNFNTAPPLSGTDETISAMTYVNGVLYVGATLYQGGTYSGRILKYASSNWSEVTNSYVGGRITAIAGAYAYSSQVNAYTTRLFVGGSFSDVGSSHLTAHNVAAMNPTTSPNATWYALSVNGSEGVDDEVYSLQAFSWSDFNGNYQTPGGYGSFTVFIGGKFLHAGSGAAKGIVSWNGFGYLASSWNTFSGGLDGTGSGDIAKVYGVNALLGYNSAYYQSSIDTMYATGSFTKTVGANTAYHAIKWSSNAWAYIGHAFMGYAYDNNCAPYDYLYSSFYGECVVVSGTTPYFGGFHTGVESASGSVIGGCSDGSTGCGPYYVVVGLATANGSGMSTSCSLNKTGSIRVTSGRSLASYSSNLYIAAGSDDGGLTSAFKYASGALTALPSGSGSPNGGVAAVHHTATSSTAAFFASDQGVFRYTY